MESEKDHYIKANTDASSSKTKILKQGNSFGVFDFTGDIHQLGKDTQGLYHRGTRFLSEWQFTMEDDHPLFLSSDTSEDNEILTVDLNNPEYQDRNGETIGKGKLHVLRTKFLHAGVAYEQIAFKNYCLIPLDVDIKMKFESDFADIFEVRGEKRNKRGNKKRAQSQKDEMVLAYLGLDKVERRTRILFSPQPQVLFENEMKHNIQLQPGEDFEMTIRIAFEIDDQKPDILKYEKALKARKNYNASIKRNIAHVYTSNEQFNEWINHSSADMITMVTETQYGPYPYAGIPWFNAPFGRDSIIAALECLWMEPQIAKGTLLYLAAHQATQVDDERDAQPGKILHEKREGEMANLGEVPFGQYYGTVDATPLFICLAGKYYGRTGDEKTLRKIWDNIEKAMQWIDTFGDNDGDGFVEYEKKSAEGLTNQGWKDSADAIFYENGTIAEGGISLCEVQGYTYCAKRLGAGLAKVMGKSDLAKRWEKEARKLKKNFNELFWSKSKNVFYLALDSNKKPCNVIASNAGQCLFTEIAHVAKAKKVAKAMLANDMFSGWGIKTLSSNEIRHNPMSYHNGSVWPHDNALIAYGFSKYGLQKQIEKVLTGMFETSMFEKDQRLPELFCGFERRKGCGPTAYPVACSPQAWAVGAAFLLVQAMLGLEIDGKNNRIVLNHPFLPPYLCRIKVSNLQVGQEKEVEFEVEEKNGNINAKLLSHQKKIKLDLNPA